MTDFGKKKLDVANHFFCQNKRNHCLGNACACFVRVQVAPRPNIPPELGAVLADLGDLLLTIWAVVWVVVRLEVVCATCAGGVCAGGGCAGGGFG